MCTPSQVATRDTEADEMSMLYWGDEVEESEHSRRAAALRQVVVYHTGASPAFDEAARILKFGDDSLLNRRWFTVGYDLCVHPIMCAGVAAFKTSSCLFSGRLFCMEIEHDQGCVWSVGEGERRHCLLQHRGENSNIYPTQLWPRWSLLHST